MSKSHDADSLPPAPGGPCDGRPRPAEAPRAHARGARHAPSGRWAHVALVGHPLVGGRSRLSRASRNGPATSGPTQTFLRSGRRRNAAAGFTLIEVMLAAIVLVLGITTAITTLQHGFRAIDSARNLTYASQVMQSEMERLRLKSWAQLQALQDTADTAVTIPGMAGAAQNFTCTRTIRDVKADMKEIVLISEWRGVDGRPHTARYITRYSKTGLYDYFYTAH